MLNIVEELLKAVHKDSEKYKLYNGHDVLYLPLHVPMGISLLQFMQDFFYKYISLLNDNNKILVECGIKDVSSITKIVSEFRDAYLKMHNEILSGNANTAYDDMENFLKEEYFIKTKIDSNNSPTLYRARTGNNYTQKEDFYHIPFNKTYLCNSYRFSIAGYPTLYLGYTKEVCKKEIRGKEGSCIEMALKGEFDIIDLTWDNTSKKSASVFLCAYPIIAACYVVPFFCKHLNKECTEIYPKYKEQYIFPQFITMYIKRHLGVKGIKYFTTRDDNLDPSKNDSKNLALFPQYTSNGLYDMELIDRFVFGKVSII